MYTLGEEMGFFDVFKRKEQKVQNKDPLADILSQVNLPNQQQTQQTVQQNVNTKNVSSTALPLPQIPTFNNVQSTSNPTSVVQNTLKTDSNTLSSQTIPSFKGIEQVNQPIAKKETSQQLTQQVKKESEDNLTQKEYYFYKNTLFVDSKYYEKVYSSLVDSMKMLQTYKKIIDVSLQREDFEDIMKNYYDSLDEMNRLLLKLDKSIFDD